MNVKKEDIPVIMQAPNTIMRAMPNCGGITVGYSELPKGTDFTPLLKGLNNDSCHSAHWGYVLEGKILLIYDDGTEELTSAGEAFYWPAGHTGIVQEDITMLEFSPSKDFSEVIAHVGKKMAEMESST
ncbi:cupin domain-containing protein [Algoriphagus aquimarinus]|uniref:Cupin domain-containing protein n=1 Tax=Algoriphagus aquimarinus TaxID=237018 RepID=A0A1I1BXF6_9BACT|nr:cupin domain-containing protein [Algoriphagus aquimarinus]SFB53348.1 hypothetical protein SAMN04489723_11735 [Algoriphagus aquimarinus]